MEGMGQESRPLVVMALSSSATAKAASRGGANQLAEWGDRVRSLQAGLRAWLAKQPTHVEAAVATAVGAMQGAALGGLMGTLTPASERFIGMFSSPSPSSSLMEPSFITGDEFHEDDFLFSASSAASLNAPPDGSRSPSRVPQGHLGLLATLHEGGQEAPGPPSLSLGLPPVGDAESGEIEVDLPSIV